jgi:hypothetical protein
VLRAVFDTVVIQNLVRYYERKPPVHEATDLWFTRVSKIPDESIDWMVKRIQETSEIFPKNLPNVLWDTYREWLATYPEKRALPQGIICKHCDGNGYVFAQRLGSDNHPKEFVFRCEICDQAPEIGIPVWKLHKHEKEVYYLIPDQTVHLTHMSVKQMVDLITKPIDDGVPF